MFAAAGVKRLGLSKYITEYLEIWVPAIGQGAIGIKSRKDNNSINQIMFKLNHENMILCVKSEKLVNFEASCSTPIGAWVINTQNIFNNNDQALDKQKNI